MNTVDAKRVLETALICAPQPVTLRELRTLFDDVLGSDTLKDLLLDLQRSGRKRRGAGAGGVGLAFPEPAGDAHLPGPAAPEAARYTRAALETLAIIAYRQPVTRGDIEDIRGVTVNSLIIKQLEDRGWVEVIGHRETVGRPSLFATTRQFLDDLGLQSLDQLPMLEEPESQQSLFKALEEAGGDPQQAQEAGEVVEQPPVQGWGPDEVPAVHGGQEGGQADGPGLLEQVPLDSEDAQESAEECGPQAPPAQSMDVVDMPDMPDAAGAADTATDTTDTDGAAMQADEGKP